MILQSFFASTGDCLKLRASLNSKPIRLTAGRDVTSIYVSGCHGLYPAKMRSMICELASVFCDLFNIHLLTVAQMVKTCSVGRPESSKLPRKNTLRCRFCPAKWQIFKVGGHPPSHALLSFIRVRRASFKACQKWDASSSGAHTYRYKDFGSKRYNKPKRCIFVLCLPYKHTANS